MQINQGQTYAPSTIENSKANLRDCSIDPYVCVCCVCLIRGSLNGLGKFSLFTH